MKLLNFGKEKKERKLKKSFYTKIRTKTESYIYQFVFTNINKNKCHKISNTHKLNE